MLPLLPPWTNRTASKASWAQNRVRISVHIPPSSSQTSALPLLLSLQPLVLFSQQDSAWDSRADFFSVSACLTGDYAQLFARLPTWIVSRVNCLPVSVAWIIIFFIIIMVSGPGRCPGRPGGVVRYLASACLLSLLLHLPQARASYYPQSGECKGKGKDCTGKKPAAAAAAWLCVLCCGGASVVGARTMNPSEESLSYERESDKPACGVTLRERSVSLWGVFFFLSQNIAEKSSRRGSQRLCGAQSSNWPLHLIRCHMSLIIAAFIYIRCLVSSSDCLCSKVSIRRRHDGTDMNVAACCWKINILAKTCRSGGILVSCGINNFPCQEFIIILQLWLDVCFQHTVLTVLIEVPRTGWSSELLWELVPFFDHFGKRWLRIWSFFILYKYQKLDSFHPPFERKLMPFFAHCNFLNFSVLQHVELNTFHYK